ncbi:hypothetical protein NDU88_001283 [Pleurodeles waltl]|uniref:Uncharacterized protein n=1 Tax=Pleurodeles waltl TaxID=8319 RepID=A0AAV7NIJ5_PLEWA|nr:hypothetical protein NDU88_001283 [Pleurodeles waltl]
MARWRGEDRVARRLPLALGSREPYLSHGAPVGPPPGAGNPEYRKGLRGPPRQSSPLPASRLRRRSNVTPPPGQASSTEASRGSTGSQRRTFLARIRSTVAAEGVGARWDGRSGGLRASVAARDCRAPELTV